MAEQKSLPYVTFGMAGGAGTSGGGALAEPGDAGRRRVAGGGSGMVRGGVRVVGDGADGWGLVDGHGDATGMHIPGHVCDL